MQRHLSSYYRPGRGLRTAAVLLVLAALVPSTAIAETPALFTEAHRSLAAAEARRVELYRARPEVLEIRVGALAVAPAAAGKRLRLDLVGGEQLVMATREIQRRGAGDYTWFGGDTRSDRWAVLVVDGTDVVGTVRIDDRLFSVRPLGGGLHAVLRLDESALPEEHPPGFDDLVEGSDDLSGAAADGAVETQWHCNEVDVIVAYTDAAQAASGNAAALAQAAVDLTNESLANSAINPRLRLVHAYRTGLDESGDIWVDRDRFADPDDGFADEVHALRQAYGADLAVLLTGNQPGYCGVVYGLPASASTAFAVVAENCAVDKHTFAHEVGHLFGAAHNPENDGGSAPFAYGHGYYYMPARWRTVMSYQRCGWYTPCYQVPFFSNPHVNYGGVPMGTTSTHDNARVLNQRACTVAGFRTPAPPPRPSSISVRNERCYGLNQVSWSSVFGAQEYELWGSTSSDFSSPWRLYRGPQTSRGINVSGTVYLRVRACNPSGCSSYRTASTPAQRFPGCL